MSALSIIPDWLESDPVGPRRHIACRRFGIKLERYDVSKVIGLDRRADPESNLTLRATQELALDQAAVPQFQGIGPRDRRGQNKSND